MPQPKVNIAGADGSLVAVTSDALDVNIAGATNLGEVQILGNNTFLTGAIALTDSATQLSVALCKHIDIMANLSNTGIVYIGSDGVDATKGIALYPGDVYSISISNMSHLYAMSTVSGDDINVQVFS